MVARPGMRRDDQSKARDRGSINDHLSIPRLKPALTANTVGALLQSDRLMFLVADRRSTLGHADMTHV